MCAFVHTIHVSNWVDVENGADRVAKHMYLRVFPYMSNFGLRWCAISTRVQVKTFKLKSARPDATHQYVRFNLECIRQFNNNKYLFGHLASMVLVSAREVARATVTHFDRQFAVDMMVMLFWSFCYVSRIASQHCTCMSTAHCVRALFCVGGSRCFGWWHDGSNWNYTF